MDAVEFNIPNFLARVPLFSDLSPKELERTAQGCQLHRLARGEAVFRYLMPDPRFDRIPLILETIDESIWSEEIAWLRTLAG